MIELKDILLPLCDSQKAYVFHLDKEKHFWQKVYKTKQFIISQSQYLSYYSKYESDVLTLPKTIKPEQIIGEVCIHPTAQIHQDAVIGPNVTIGKYALVGAGSRIKNSIVLEDVVIQDHVVIINSIIGWSTLVGSWARIEGILKVVIEN